MLNYIIPKLIDLCFSNNTHGDTCGGPGSGNVGPCAVGNYATAGCNTGYTAGGTCDADGNSAIFDCNPTGDSHH